MENRNIMLVIASIAFLFVIVVGVGLWLFWPKDTTLEGTAAASADTLFDKNFDSFEYYRGREELPGLTEEPQKPEEEAAIDKAEEETAAEKTSEEDITIAFGEAEKLPGDKVIIEPKDVSILPKEAVPSDKSPASVKTPVKTTVPEKAVSKPTAAASKPTAPERITEKKPATITKKEYEIQVGSYKTRNYAERINDQLKKLGFPGLIRTRDIGGATYYRVRLGPYSNENEAQKFLSWIKDIDGFGESYISQVTRVYTN